MRDFFAAFAVLAGAPNAVQMHCLRSTAGLGGSRGGERREPRSKHRERRQPWAGPRRGSERGLGGELFRELRVGQRPPMIRRGPRHRGHSQGAAASTCLISPDRYRSKAQADADGGSSMAHLLARGPLDAGQRGGDLRASTCVVRKCSMACWISPEMDQFRPRWLIFNYSS